MIQPSRHKQQRSLLQVPHLLFGIEKESTVKEVFQATTFSSTTCSYSVLRTNNLRLSLKVSKQKKNLPREVQNRQIPVRLIAIQIKNKSTCILTFNLFGNKYNSVRLGIYEACYFLQFNYMILFTSNGSTGPVCGC